MFYNIHCRLSTNPGLPKLGVILDFFISFASISSPSQSPTSSTPNLVPVYPPPSTLDHAQGLIPSHWDNRSSFLSALSLPSLRPSSPCTIWQLEWDSRVSVGSCNPVTLGIKSKVLPWPTRFGVTRSCPISPQSCGPLPVLDTPALWASCCHPRRADSFFF